MNLRKGIVLLLSIVLVLGISSCSDDDNKESYNPTDAEYLPGDYPIKIAIFENFETEDESDFGAMLFGFEESDEISIEVDGASYPFAFGLGIHLSMLEFDGSLNTFELTVNGTKAYEFTLKNVPIAEANWPEFYPIGEAFDLKWTLSPDENPMYQDICYEETDNDHQFTLDPSDRDFTIPAEWCKEDTDHFEIELWVINYDVDNDLLATSMSLSMGDYNSFKNFKSVQERIAEYLDKFKITR